MVIIIFIMIRLGIWDSVTISYYANKKYKTLPKLYRLDKLSDNVIIEIARKNAESYLKIKTRKFDIWKVG